MKKSEIIIQQINELIKIAENDESIFLGYIDVNIGSEEDEVKLTLVGEGNQDIERETTTGALNVKVCYYQILEDMAFLHIDKNAKNCTAFYDPKGLMERFHEKARAADPDFYFEGIITKAPNEAELIKILQDKIKKRSQE